jgi:hypothetical protein
VRVLHVATSVGWLGAVAAFLALVAVGIGADGRQTDPLAAAAIVVWWVVLPLALASLATGILSSLVSPWGLLRHYWVVTKLVLTAVATVVLVLQMPTVATLAEQPPVAAEAATSSVVHAIGGMVVLLAATVLGVVKPRGMTRRGARRGRRDAGMGSPDGTSPAVNQPSANPTGAAGRAR